MMTTLRALVIAFSMYSQIPMPQFTWQDKEMKYAFCFFPWVGAAIGGITMFWWWFCGKFSVGNVAFAMIGTAIPLAVTGGFHVDGFMDTMDAFHSYQPREKKLEILISGGSIRQQIEENLTYDYLHSSEDNLWSILYLTGYLTKVGERDKDGQIELRIPNKEVKEIFESTVRKWFEDSARVTNRKDLFDAVWNKDADKATKEISTLLRMTISYYDYREDFYHAFLAGIFAGAGYSVESNREHGEGRSDIVIYNDVTGQVAVFEAKYSRKLEDLEKDCQKVLDQINTKMYAKEFEDAYEEVLCYGIAFYKKRCLVKSK